MVTTIQIDEKTLLLLKKLKEDLKTNSYNEAIQKAILKSMNQQKSMGGSLRKYYKNYNREKMLKELQEERRKSDRF
jgi:hypothetical protein